MKRGVTWTKQKPKGKSIIHYSTAQLSHSYIIPQLQSPLLTLSPQPQPFVVIAVVVEMVMVGGMWSERYCKYKTCFFWQVVVVVVFMWYWWLRFLRWWWWGTPPWGGYSRHKQKYISELLPFHCNQLPLPQPATTTTINITNTTTTIITTGNWQMVDKGNKPTGHVQQVCK